MDKARYLEIRRAILSHREPRPFSLTWMAAATGYPRDEVEAVLEELYVNYSVIRETVYTWLEGPDDDR